MVCATMLRLNAANPTNQPQLRYCRFHKLYSPIPCKEVFSLRRKVAIRFASCSTYANLAVIVK